MAEFDIIEEFEDYVTFSQGELTEGVLNIGEQSYSSGVWTTAVSGIKADGELIEATEVTMPQEVKPTPAQVFWYIAQKLKDILDVNDAKP